MKTERDNPGKKLLSENERDRIIERVKKQKFSTTRNPSSARSSPSWTDKSKSTGNRIWATRESTPSKAR